jgi:hypothetical protein
LKLSLGSPNLYKLLNHNKDYYKDYTNSLHSMCQISYQYSVDLVIYPKNPSRSGAL